MSIQSAVTGRSCTAALLATAVLVLATFSSCSSRDATEVRATVEHFLTALHAGDREELARLAPGMGGADKEKLEKVLSAMAHFSSWSITEVNRRGSSARARVTLSANGQETEVMIPLSLVDNTWTVDSRMSVTTRLDFVPLTQ